MPSNKSSVTIALKRAIAALKNTFVSYQPPADVTAPNDPTLLSMMRATDLRIRSAASKTNIMVCEEESMNALMLVAGGQIPFHPAVTLLVEARENWHHGVQLIDASLFEDGQDLTTSAVMATRAAAQQLGALGFRRAPLLAGNIALEVVFAEAAALAAKRKSGGL